jgi:hypothetical protein
MSYEESQNSLNFRMYRALFMKQFKTSNEEASPEYKKYYQVLDNLSKQMEDNNKGINVVESKRQLYKNFVCYNELYQKFIKSNYAELHAYGLELYEYNIKPYESVRDNLEKMYKSAKNKTRNARGNLPMNGIYRHLTNNAMARSEMNKLNQQNPIRRRNTQKKSNKTKGTLINGFNTNVRT